MAILTSIYQCGIYIGIGAFILFGSLLGYCKEEYMRGSGAYTKGGKTCLRSEMFC